MENCFLHIDNLTVEYYGGYTAVSNASFTMNNGDLLCIVGGRSSGKSSLLKAIGGMEPCGGKIYMNGEDITGSSIKSRNFALSFGNDSLSRNKTVRDILAYPMKIRKTFSKSQVEERTRTIAEIWGLTSCLRMKVGMLNNATKSALIIARTFMLERELYMFDNPLSNIHGIEREELLALISSSISLTNKPIIYATDRIEEAMSLAPNKYAIISGGILSDTGNIHSIAYDPSSLSVARLISSDMINVYECDMMGDIVTLNNNGIKLNNLLHNNFTRVVVAIYPQDIICHKSGSYSGEVISRTDYIRERKYTLKFMDTNITIITNYDIVHDVGSIIKFNINSNKMLVFDAVSELNIRLTRGDIND